MNNLSSRQKVKEFLSANPVGVLSTVSPDSAPYSTTVYFFADDDLNIFILSKKETKKIENIKSNNKVMMVVFEVSSQSNAQISGVAEEVRDYSEHQETFKKILEITHKISGAEVPPVSKLFAGPYVVYQIKPDTIIYSVYNQKDLEMATFDTIEF